MITTPSPSPALTPLINNSCPSPLPEFPLSFALQQRKSTSRSSTSTSRSSTSTSRSSTSTLGLGQTISDHLSLPKVPQVSHNRFKSRQFHKFQKKRLRAKLELYKINPPVAPLLPIDLINTIVDDYLGDICPFPMCNEDRASPTNLCYQCPFCAQHLCSRQSLIINPNSNLNQNQYQNSPQKQNERIMCTDSNSKNEKIISINDNHKSCGIIKRNKWEERKKRANRNESNQSESLPILVPVNLGVSALCPKCSELKCFSCVLFFECMECNEKFCEQCKIQSDSWIENDCRDQKKCKCRVLSLIHMI